MRPNARSSTPQRAVDLASARLPGVGGHQRGAVVAVRGPPSLDGVGVLAQQFIDPCEGARSGVGTGAFIAVSCLS
jgi:hypothetical protein